MNSNREFINVNTNGDFAKLRLFNKPLSRVSTQNSFNRKLQNKQRNNTSVRTKRVKWQNDKKLLPAFEICIICSGWVDRRTRKRCPGSNLVVAYTTIRRASKRCPRRPIWSFLFVPRPPIWSEPAYMESGIFGDGTTASLSRCRNHGRWSCGLWLNSRRCHPQDGDITLLWCSWWSWCIVNRI